MQLHISHGTKAMDSSVRKDPTRIMSATILVPWVFSLLSLGMLLMDGRIVLSNNCGECVCKSMQGGEGQQGGGQYGAVDLIAASSSCEAKQPSSASPTGHILAPACHVLVAGIKSTMNCSNKTAKDPLVSFVDVLAESKTDKRKHHYGHMYAEYLDALRVQGEVNLMEIGLFTGSSVDVWTKFFERGRVYGMDLWVIKPKEEMKAQPNPRIKIFEGDQANVTFLAETAAAITEEVGLLDFIVDDGGHTMTQQITSFTHLLSLVKPGGFYFIEDVETSYFDQCPGKCYGGGEVGKKGTTIDMIKSLIDVLNADYFKGHTFKVGRGTYSVNAADKLVGSIQCWRNIIWRLQRTTVFDVLSA